MVDELRIKVTADASGVKKGMKEAKKSLEDAD